MSHPYLRALSTLLISLSLSFSVAAADKAKTKSSDANQPSYELPQPQRETLNLAVYQQIRDEGLGHSHVMEYASALDDGIGPRLTGSPNLKRANEWTRDQFTAMGCSNAHLEDWGEFGMGWEQLNIWIRMSSPDKAVFIAQAAPWSPSTNGPVSGPALWVDIKDEKDFDKYIGQLAGKIVLLGDMREVKPVEKPLFSRADEAELKKIQEYPLGRDRNAPAVQQFMQRLNFREKLGNFLASEKAIAVILPSRDGENGGGSGGTIFDDNGSSFGRLVYQRDHANP